MDIEKEIINLIGELKKEMNPEKKKMIKHKLKQLYKKLNKFKLGKKKVDFKLPIKKEVEELLSGQKEDFLKNKKILLQLKKNINKEVEKLQEAISVETNPKKKNELVLKLDEKINEIKVIDAATVPQVPKVKINWKKAIDESSLKDVVRQELQNKPELLLQFQQTGKIPIELSSTVGRVVSKINRQQGTTIKTKDILNESLQGYNRPLLPSEVPSIKEELESKSRSRSRSRSRRQSQVEDPFLEEESTTPAYTPPAYAETEEWFNTWSLDPQEKADAIALQDSINKAESEIAKKEKASALTPSQKQAIYEAYTGVGKMKKIKKMKGGAGIADYLSVLGNVPGLSSMAGMVPIIGPMLAPAIGLAQTAAKVGSQGMKEAGLGPSEGIKGIFGTIGRLFGMGRKMSNEFYNIHASGGSMHSFYNKHKSKLNKKGIHGAGFLSDIAGIIGGITPHISTPLGFIPAVGPVLQMGNSAIGSASRVAQDMLKKIGLGKKKKGGLKMLPNPLSSDGMYPENEMAHILPFYGTGNLPNGGNVSEEYEDYLNQQIVNLLKQKHLQDVKNYDEFTAQLLAKQNTEQQSAVFQLLYQQLLNNAQQEYQRNILNQ